MDWIIILVMAGVSFLSHSLVGTVQARGYDLAGAWEVPWPRVPGG